MNTWVNISLCPGLSAKVGRFCTSGSLTLRVVPDYDPTMLARSTLRALVLGTYAACWVVLALLSLPHQAAGGPQQTDSRANLVPVTTPEGAILWVEVARTARQRATGLMFRESLAPDRGMLFTFSEAQLWTIWMKNTRIPLDIIWLDREKRIVHVEANVPICLRKDEGCPQYQPNEKAWYVLEVGEGIAASLQLERGTRLRFPVEAPGPPRK
ncbi:MAG: DUF192 domain-containing protein [Nitrospirales bacterium]